MREKYTKFEALGCEVLDVGPDSASDFREYWAKNDIPFPGLADPRARVAKLYEQGWKLLKLGRMPAQLVIDREGVIRDRHDASSMSDIPPVASVLTTIEKL